MFNYHLIMKRSRILVVGFWFLAFVFTCSDVQAALAKGPIQKLTRGFVHVLASPAQLPKHVLETAYETEPFYLGTWSAMTMGAGNGLYHVGRQLVSGGFDIFTFFSPAGRDWAPLFEPSSLFPEV